MISPAMRSFGGEEVASWFFCDAHGVSTVRVPDGRTIGMDFAWRSYFHGGRVDMEENWRPKRGEHLTATTLSDVFPSKDTSLWIVAVSAPVFNESSPPKFLGAVAMINSLRLHGHTEPVYLLDLGLTPIQRELLAPEVSLVEAPPDTEPWLAKTVAPLRHPAEVMVLIDVDMVVTRPLGELIERAREGRVVAFENDIDRFVAEWGEILDLGPLERRP